MIRLNIVCEGQTESRFVTSTAAPHFAIQGLGVSAPIIGDSSTKGGSVNLERTRDMVTRCLIQDRNSYCTTFIDYYGIDANFPGKSEAIAKSLLSDKQDTVCTALSDALAQTLDDGPMRRFIPYVQMHEFEGLLFSDPNQLAIALRRLDLTQNLWKIRHDFPTPEHINDSPVTAPSKQLRSLVPRYRKIQMGERAARAITLKAIRQECPLFNGWLTKLENLPPLPA